MREQRVAGIIEYLSKKKMCSLDELCDNFHVSKNTIRKDVCELALLNLVSKVYGGIVLNEKNTKLINDCEVIPYSWRLEESMDAKQFIGRMAAGLIQDGDTIFIDSGTTPPYILPHLVDRINLHVITNSLSVLNEAKIFGIDTYCLGGVYMPKTDSFVGGLLALGDIRITKALMGASFIDIRGITNFSYHEAEMKRAVINRSDSIIVMADSKKFGRAATICFCQIDDVSTIVTDKCPPKEFVALAVEHGIKLLYGIEE